MGVSFVQDSDRVQTGSVGESSSEKWERGQQGWDAEPSAEGFRLPLGRGMFGPTLLIALGFQRLLCLFQIPVVKVGRQCVTSFLGGHCQCREVFYLFLKCFTCSFVHFFIYLAAPGLSCDLRDPSVVASGIEPGPPALEELEVLASGPPGESQCVTSIV